MANETNPAAEPDKKSHRVLIADDDLPTRMLLRAAINRWGYETIEASDGEQAWEILDGPEKPRLLILDWLMPKLDGIALCERIKEKLPYHPYTILLTQLAGTTNIIKALEAGADEFLSKPFNIAELHSRLSTGSRIIEYEDILVKKNVELENYIKQLNAGGATAPVSTKAMSNAELVTLLEDIAKQKGGKINVSNESQNLHITLDLPSQ